MNWTKDENDDNDDSTDDVVIRVVATAVDNFVTAKSG